MQLFNLLQLLTVILISTTINCDVFVCPTPADRQNAINDPNRFTPRDAGYCARPISGAERKEDRKLGYSTLDGYAAWVVRAWPVRGGATCDGMMVHGRGQHAQFRFCSVRGLISDSLSETKMTQRDINILTTHV
ncbi:hypothetical protein PTTG_12430 [Puccinia triticina 1-1 BBBD Race 1]|uniref:Secreted protein n=2 Tax=Puccinia triticina TaxID=208348 RepID=A0A180GCL8_PUCT1|nr:uncharacterized protein PtA15_13A324 [Puccinia triticina]OAV89663.1 hypothetical protein PTTG_12430 [Puccinia triticina 1-1 BBBD Race 1]WAQ90924.1 hypothetical protein PtA15_13A324 [Puccinia triticina]WAR61109.1 hypothetical protein PtB15_13B361 [Puccinia triticina]